MNSRSRVVLGVTLGAVAIGGAFGAGTLFNNDISADVVSSLTPNPWAYGASSVKLWNQVSDTFDNLKEGQAEKLGWETYKPASAEIIVSATAGKNGNGLLLRNATQKTGYTDIAFIGHPIPPSTSGTLEFDVRPRQTGGTLTIVLKGQNGAIANYYLWYDGTVRTFNGGYKQIGSLQYKADTWNHLVISWSNGVTTVSVNGQGATTVPYSYPTPLLPVTNVTMTAGYGDGTHIGGRFDLDNVSYPSNTQAATAPTITSISPTSVTNAQLDFTKNPGITVPTLTITGTGFTKDSAIFFDEGSSDPNKFQRFSPTTNTGTMLTLPLVSLPIGIHKVFIHDNATGADSNSLTLTVTKGPTVTSISPTSVTAASLDFTKHPDVPNPILTITGTGFTKDSAIFFDEGSSDPNKFQRFGPTTNTDTVLTVPLYFLSAGTHKVFVHDNITGVDTNSLTLTVTQGPTITSISPTSVTTAQIDFTKNPGITAPTLTITGTGFTKDSVISFDEGSSDPSKFQRFSPTTNTSTTLTLPLVLLSVGTHKVFIHDNATGVDTNSQILTVTK